MNQLKEKILEHLSEQELEDKIKEKTEKFSGMLNNEAALFLIAREQGIGTEEKNTFLNELKKGQTVNVKGEIISVYPEREFESKGKKGKVKNILIKDKTGTAYLVLWNGDTEKILEKDSGKKIELTEFSVDEFNGKIQLNKRFNGNFTLKENQTIQETKKINELIDGERNISVKAMVLREFPLKEFESKGKKGMLKKIELIDENKRIILVLWNEKAKEKLSEKLIEITNLNARNGLNELELHSTNNTEIKEIKEGKLKEYCINFFGKKELNKVTEGNRFIAEGKIKGINKTKLLFNVCPECKKSIQEENNAFFCKTCGQILKPEKKLVVSFELEDETALINTMVYGKKAEKIIGKTTEEIEKKTNEIIIDEIITELNEKIKGKEISFLAKAKNNSFNEETELVLEKLL